jgi:hypothetical protein
VRALEAEGPVRPRAEDDLQLLLEDVHPLAGGREREPVRLVLALVPAGADPELDPAVGDVVGGDHGLRQQRRVAERRGRDERPEAQGGRDGAERRERRPRVERTSLGMVATELQVVVGAKERRNPMLLTSPRKRDPLRPGNTLLALDHQAELHAAGHYDAGLSGAVSELRRPAA